MSPDEPDRPAERRAEGGRQARPRFNEVERLVASAAEALPDFGDDSFARVFDRYGDARVVMLGTACPGVSEFARARAQITRRLIERHGFTVVAVEADWADGRRIDHFTRHRAPVRDQGWAFADFPGWAWRTTEMRSFIDWLRAWNGRTARGREVRFVGLDIFSLHSSICLTLQLLDRIAPQAAVAARLEFSELAPWHFGAYGLREAAGDEGLHPYENEVVHRLGDALVDRLEAAADEVPEGQAAKLLHSAERYYRYLYRGAPASWNLRNRHMFDLLLSCLGCRSPPAKAVVWAHNAQAGNSAATEMGWSGTFNLGELARRSLGEAAVLVGCGGDHGRIAAAADWGAAAQAVPLPPARFDSYEHLFAGAARKQFLLELGERSAPPLRDFLSEPRPERLLDVIYHPGGEREDHYVLADLSQQFDAVLWFDELRPVAPLPVGRLRGIQPDHPFAM